MTLWRWLMRRFDVGAPDAMIDLAAQRAEAQRKLSETERVGREVRGVAEIARRLREQNNFAEKLNEAFGRPDRG